MGRNAPILLSKGAIFLTDQELEQLIFMLRLQSVSAPMIFLSRQSTQNIIDSLEHYLTKINQNSGYECKNLIKILKEQLPYTPNVMLSLEDIQLTASYLTEYKRMLNSIEEYKPTYIPKSEALYGKCVLQVRFENEEEYKKWKEFNQRYVWSFDHTYPAIMRAEYEFHTVIDVELMAKEIVSLLEMGFDVRAVDWKVREYKSQLEK